MYFYKLGRIFKTYYSFYLTFIIAVLTFNFFIFCDYKFICEMKPLAIKINEVIPII